MLDAVYIPLSVFAVTGTLFAFLFLSRSRLASLLIGLLAIVSVFALVNIEAIQLWINEHVHGGSSLLRSLGFITTAAVLSIAWTVVGLKRSVVASVVIPLVLAIVSLSTWSYSRSVCEGATTRSFEVCALHVPIFAVSEVVIFVVLAFCEVICLGALLPVARHSTPTGWAARALCVSVAGVICWSMLSITGIVTVSVTGHESSLQQTLRPITFLATAGGKIVGLYIFGSTEILRILRFRRKMRPLRERLDAISSPVAALSGTVVTRMMDQLAVGLENDGVTIVDEPTGGEEDVARWILGQTIEKAEVPVTSSRQLQAGWLSKVSEHLDHGRA